MIPDADGYALFSPVDPQQLPDVVAEASFRSCKISTIILALCFMRNAAGVDTHHASQFCLSFFSDFICFVQRFVSDIYAGRGEAPLTQPWVGRSRADQQPYYSPHTYGEKTSSSISVSISYCFSC